MYKKLLSTFLFMFVIGILSFLIGAEKIQAATHNIHGWAWGASSDLTPNGGIGWISLNCNDPGANSCAVDYGIDMDASGNITGYAWSNNYGWLKFGGLSGFPSVSAPGTTPSNAKLVDGDIVGWARFLNGDDLDDGDPGHNWDGWVSFDKNEFLSDSNYRVILEDYSHGFGPTANTSFAWAGGLPGAGWIKFDIYQGDTYSCSGTYGSGTPCSGATENLTSNGTWTPVGSCNADPSLNKCKYVSNPGPTTCDPIYQTCSGPNPSCNPEIETCGNEANCLVSGTGTSAVAKVNQTVTFYVNNYTENPGLTWNVPDATIISDTGSQITATFSKKGDFIAHLMDGETEVQSCSVQIKSNIIINPR